MFCLGPGSCRQTVDPIWAAALWPVLVQLQATPLGPEGSMPPGSIPYGGHEQTLLRSPSGGPPSVPDWQGWPGQQLPFWGLLWGGHSGFLGKLVFENTPGENPHMWQLVPQRQATGGPHVGSASMQTCMQCPQTPVLPCILMTPNGGMVTFWVVWTGPQTSRQNPLDAVWSQHGEGVTSFSAFLSPFESVQGNWSDPDITTLKWACFQVAVALISSPLGHRSHCPVYDFRSDHDWDLLGVGCGQYDKKHDIFIITFYTWDL